MSTAQATIAWESAYKGYTETPVNKTIFALMAGVANGEPWCAAFQIAAMRSSGVAIPAGADSPYTPTMFAGFKRDGRTFEIPEPGDLGFIYYTSLGRIGHVVMVADVAGDTVSTWEGNSGQSTSRTGGQVVALKRNFKSRGGTAYFAGFARPGYDGKGVTLANLPVRADHTGALVVPAALVSHAGDGKLVVDGDLGPATIRAMQIALGAPTTGALDAPTVRALQARLNTAIGAHLAVDGKIGPLTIRALQAYLGTPRDGVISHPHSEVVAAVQRRLNAATFFVFTKAA